MSVKQVNKFQVVEQKVHFQNPAAHTSVVARCATCGSVSDAPEKVNACFEVASFFCERVKSNFFLFRILPHCALHAAYADTDLTAQKKNAKPSKKI